MPARQRARHSAAAPTGSTPPSATGARLYDVALSFLAPDLGIAQALDSELSPELKCFVYARRQEEVAGRDGVEAFSRVFKEESRLNVVLYRDGWGETPWTRLEASAIKERGLADGWDDTLMVIHVGDANRVPPWIPRQLLYYNYSEHGLKNTAAVIRAHAMRVGATLHRETAVEHAERIAREAAEEDRRQTTLSSGAAVREAHRMVRDVYTKLDEILTAIRESSAFQLPIEWASSRGDLHFVVRSPYVSTSIRWHQRAINTLRDACLRVIRLDGLITLPGEHFPPTNRRISQVDEVTFEVGLSEESEWIWRGDVGDFSSAGLADWIVQRHLQRIRQRPNLRV